MERSLMLEHENYSFKYLDWDTKFFNVTSGRLSLMNIISREEWNDIVKLLSKREFNVIDNINNDPDNAFLISKLNGAFVADINVQFEKKLSRTLHDITCNNIVIENDKQYNDGISEIAKDSFKHSRFFNDPYLDKGKSRLVYSEWVKSSYNKKDKYFISYNEDGNCLGFLLFSIYKDLQTAIIELIGVKNNFENKSIGKKMMIAIESFLINEYPSLHLIKVGTQCKNLNALNFYQSCGYRMKEIRMVYHYWPYKQTKNIEMKLV